MAPKYCFPSGFGFDEKGQICNPENSPHALRVNITLPETHINLFPENGWLEDGQKAYFQVLFAVSSRDSSFTLDHLNYENTKLRLKHFETHIATHRIHGTCISTYIWLNVG